MKKGDFIVWRYIAESTPDKTITRFGFLEEEQTFHYLIRDADTGELIRVLQPMMCIVLDPKYHNLKNKTPIIESMSPEEVKKMYIKHQNDIGV